MKITIVNRDIDDPEETKVIAPVELDLGLEQADPAESPPERSRDFISAIEQAAIDNVPALQAEEQRAKRRQAKAAFDEGQKALADRVKQDTGFSVGYAPGYAFKPRSKEAYKLWKRVITLYVNNPDMLDVGMTALARKLQEGEPNFSITKDMMYDKLNRYAVADLKRHLVNLGVTLKLTIPVTISSVRKDLIKKRDDALTLVVEEFTVRIQITGDTATVNGKPYKIQVGSSGKRRIGHGKTGWLPLDTLKDFGTVDR